MVYHAFLSPSPTNAPLPSQETSHPCYRRPIPKSTGNANSHHSANVPRKQAGTLNVKLSSVQSTPRTAIDFLVLVASRAMEIFPHKPVNVSCPASFRFRLIFSEASSSGTFSKSWNGILLSVLANPIHLSLRRGKRRQKRSTILKRTRLKKPVWTQSNAHRVSSSSAKKNVYRKTS